MFYLQRQKLIQVLQRKVLAPDGIEGRRIGHLFVVKRRTRVTRAIDAEKSIGRAIDLVNASGV